MKTREEMNSIEQEFLGHFTEDEINKFKRYIELNTRVNILKQMVGELSELDELLSTSKGVGATSLIVSRQWLVEMETEFNKLQEEIALMVYWKDLKDYAVKMKNRFDAVIESEIPKRITQEFLNNKFGEDGSCSKDAMVGICTEAVNYFIGSVTSGNLIKAADENISNNS